MKNRRPVVAALSALLIALVVAIPARAAFPGANGRITFTRCDSSSCNDGDIWSFGADGSSPLQLSSGTATYDEEPAYSADGKRVTYEQCGPGDTSHCTIVIANSDGTGVTPLSDGTHFDYYPSFSPNGGLIAFSRSQSGGSPILTVPSLGGATVPLTSGSGSYDETASFSPDGTRIVFERYTPSVSDSIWIMNADGSGQVQLTHQAPTMSDQSPDWSPDGTKIVFSRFDTTVHQKQVWVMDADGSNAHQITPATANISDDQPAFSPDGTKIAFVHDLGPTSPIEVMNADGSGAVVVTNAANREYGPSWQPAAPVLSGAPAIAGSAVDGQTLTATAAAAVGGGTAAFQWMRCAATGSGCAAIAAATAGSYTLTSADIGHAVEVMQTQTNAVGPTSASSAPTAGIAANPVACSNAFTGTAVTDTLLGTAGGDRITGLAGNDVLSGGSGNDCISGGKGNDRISGGGGKDKLNGGAGKDRINGGPGKDSIVAGSGNDKINVADGTRDTVSCGSGTDSIRADRKDKLRGCEHVTFARRKH